MVAYENDELIPSSEFAKKFGTYLAQIKDNSVRIEAGKKKAQHIDTLWNEL